jgi:hypothetical protein
LNISYSFKTLPAYRLLFFFSILFLSTSCLKDINDIEEFQIKGPWSPLLALPLFDDEMNTEDFIKELDSIYQVDENNFITLVYHSALLSTGIEDYLDIPDQAIGIELVDIEFPPGIDSFIFLSDHTEIRNPYFHFTANNGAELKTIGVKSGIMKIEFISDFKKSGTVFIDIPAMTKDGQAFSRAYDYTYKGSLPVRETYYLNLSDYAFDLTDNNTTYNKMEGEYRVLFKGNNEYVHRNDEFRIEVTVQNPQFSYAEGYLGQINADFRADSIHANVFHTTVKGGVYFMDPKMIISIVNSIGAPFRANIQYIRGSNPIMGSLLLTGYPSSLDIHFPGIGQMGDSVTTEMIIDNNNSNIADLIAISPKYFFYSLSALSNPDTKRHDNFVSDKSRISVYQRFELPLHGYSKNWMISDTGDLDLPESQDIEYVEFKMDAWNGFPVDARVQVFFTDENYQIFDSLFVEEPFIVSSAWVDATGKVNQKTPKYFKIKVSENKYRHVQQAKHIIIQSYLHTLQKGQVPVKIFMDYTVRLRLAALVKFKVDIND